jgi:hypothetical protein
MHKHYYSIIVILGVALLLLESCTKPIGPVVEVPDTVKSYVRAIITAPDMTNQVWEVHYPDTVSKGIVGFTSYSGAEGVREGDPAVSYIGCLHNLNPNNQSISLTIWYPHDVKTEQLLAGTANYIDSLRTWQEDRLEFLFVAPPAITAPYTPTKLRAFRWKSLGWAERYIPTSSNQWNIRALPYTNYQVSYILTSYDTLDKATIQEATLTIDRYDLEKKRISGRFSFRAIGSINGETIEIRNGVFDNVRLRAFSD